MPTQEAKTHRVGEWASLRNTSPEIAEAIFEVAHYDEKLVGGQSILDRSEPSGKPRKP